jgi:hypothetical protein
MISNESKTKEILIYCGKKKVGLATAENIKINYENIEYIQPLKFKVSLFRTICYDMLLLSIYTLGKAVNRFYYLTHAEVNDGDMTVIYCCTVSLDYVYHVWHPGPTKLLSKRLAHVQKGF